MQKKLLITISEDISCLYGVRFVSSFFGNKSVVNATLFYVAPHAEIAGKDKHLGQQELDLQISENAQKKGAQALETARGILCENGFSPKNVACKFILRQFGTVQDIIIEAKAGKYDAVVLGRRGYRLFEPFLSSNVTDEIMTREIGFPIWVCKDPEEGRKNVLLCLDGSDACHRMVDHVGFMLRDENEHAVTLLHVETGEGEDGESILRKARREHLENWISNGRVGSVVKVSSLTGVAQTMMEVAESKRYAVIAMGRLGLPKGRVKELLVGSRTKKLLEDAQKVALWVSS